MGQASRGKTDRQTASSDDVTSGQYLLEHPEESAKRILREQVGVEPSTLKQGQIDSFASNNKSWHLVFDFLAFPLSMKITKAPSLLNAQWFEIDKLPPAIGFAHHGWGHAALLKFAKTQS